MTFLAVIQRSKQELLLNRLGHLLLQLSLYWLFTSAKALQSKMRFMQQKKGKEIRLNLSAAGTGNSIIIHLLPPLCTNVVFIQGTSDKFSLSFLTRVGLTTKGRLGKVPRAYKEKGAYRTQNDSK